MNRLKYLALAALVAFAACDEGDGTGVTPTPTISGTITGTVTAEGAGVPGITVTLTGPSSQSATTGANGSFTFNNVAGGAYAVSISNIPADYVFSTTSQAVTITQDGQTASVSFAGQIVRTGSISGQVTASGAAVEGVAVTISGAEGDQTKQTGASGNYSFTGLRSGSYTVSITNPNEDVYTFNVTEQDVTLNAGESEVVNFAGTRTGGGGGGTGEQATVVIQGITNVAGGSVPTNALFGTIVARAQINEGDQDVTAIDFMIGDETVCTQTFGAAAVDGQQAGDNFVADCTINTASFDLETGEPDFLNGASTLTVEITTAAGATRTATINIGLANTDMFFATDITPESTAISPSTGNLWWGGDVEATVVPVMYSGREVARATANFAGGTETDTDPSDGFIFTFQTSTGTAADFIGNTEAANQAFTVNGVTSGGANIGASTITVQNYDDVAPSFTAAGAGVGATGNIPVSRWINDPFTFGGVNAVDGGVTGTDFVFEAGTSATTLQVVETGDDLEPSLTNNTYIVAVTAVDELGNERTVFINGTAAGTTTAAAATQIGVDVVDPVILGNTGTLQPMEAIIAGNSTIQVNLQADDRSGYGPNPLRIFVQRYTPTATTCVFEGTAGGPCDPAANSTTFDYTTAGVTGWPTDAYYRAQYYAVDNANNASNDADGVDAVTQTNVRDTQAPNVGGVFFDATLTAGGAETFTAPMADNLDLDRADFFIQYGGGPFLLMAEENLGGFGPDDGFVTQQTFSTTVNPFIGWVEQGGTGWAAANQPNPILAPSNARTDVFDFAGNQNPANTTAINSAIDAPTQQSFSAGARGPSGTVNSADLAFPGTFGGTLCQDTDNDGCGTTPTSVTASLVIQGATGQLVNHFNQVYFYVERGTAGSGDWERIGSASTSIQDDGVTRTYTYSGTVQASDFGAYAGGANEAHTLAALGVTPQGTALWITEGITINFD